MIGPTFAAELKAAGLLGVPCSWTVDGRLIFDPSMTPAQIAAVQAVLAAHNPAALAPVSVVTTERAAAQAAVTAAAKDPSPANLSAALTALAKLL